MEECLALFRRLICFSLAIIAISLSGCASKPPYRTASEHEQDQRLAERVQNALDASAVYKFPNAQVSAYDGTVQLSGFVATKAQRKYAGAVADNIPGVARVENDLIIKPIPW